MKDLKDYIRESILDDIEDQLENGTEEIIKNKITNWLKDNVVPMQENKLNFNFNTAPITVNYDGDISFKINMTSLTNGMFQWGEVEGDFNCSNCESLESLAGSPKKVGGSFDCYFCHKLKSLEGAPEKVEKVFNCSCCKSLKSLKGSPKKVGGSFWCSYCYSLKSLKDAPKEVGESFMCKNCKTKFTEDDVKKVSNVKGKIYC